MRMCSLRLRTTTRHTSNVLYFLSGRFAAFRRPNTSPFIYSSRMASTLPRSPIFEAISNHDGNAVAVVHSDSGRTFTYGELIKDVASAKDRLVELAGDRGIRGERVAFLIENSYDYVVNLLSILASHGIAMPLSAGFPAHELQYILDQSEAAVILTSEKLKDKADETLRQGLQHDPVIRQIQKTLEGSKTLHTVTLQDEPSHDDGGIMLYTSGTTSRPKGVLIPNSAIAAQAQSLIQAWKYQPSDRLLHCLPLHHVHGVMNAMIAPLMAGASLEFQFPFNATSVWTRLAAPFDGSVSHAEHTKVPITFVTVVPTIWSRLLGTYKDLDRDLQQAAKEAISPKNLRLNFSGSAALPTPTKAAWTALSGGNVLLERYGMTEVGMALSCGLAFEDRVDGSVGWPLPGVEIRLVDTDTDQVIALGEELDKEGKERQGEIQIRGPTVFREYFKNPKATASEFVEGKDGKGKWFKTGDVAVRREVDGAGKSGDDWAKGPMYFIQGRKSADIIKTGGEKVSALEVEREMLSLPQVEECAVVPIDNEQWGQKVAAVVVLSEEGKTAGKGGKPWSPLDMRRALKERLVNYKVPQEMKVVDSIPRNAMGKVNKKQLVKELWAPTS